MSPTECPICHRVMCDHTPAERGQTYAQMMGDEPLGDVDKLINFPAKLWERLVARAKSQSGIPILINGEPGTMRYMSPTYLVNVLVKKGLDELDAQEEQG